jgi:hypothetical protein
LHSAGEKIFGGPETVLGIETLFSKQFLGADTEIDKLMDFNTLKLLLTYF